MIIIEKNKKIYIIKKEKSKQFYIKILIILYNTIYNNKIVFYFF